MCDAFLVLAQADGGLSCFLVPRWTPDGERNRFRLQRLKDKLGNRSNASSEIEFDGAWARMVGEEGARRADDHRDGQPHPARLLRWARPRGCARASRRRSTTRATARRSASLLVDQPLMRNVLADLAIESEAATISALRLARAYDEAAAGDGGQTALKRVATAVLKYWICKRAPAHAAEALECLGGNGYVEESGMPRLYREAPLNSIWEGSGNVQCLDVLRAMAGAPESLDAFLAEVGEAAGAEPRLDAARRPPARGPRRPGADRGARPAAGRADGARPAGLAARALRATRPWPTPSAPRASTATGGAPSAPCPPAPTSGASSPATPRFRASARRGGGSGPRRGGSRRRACRSPRSRRCRSASGSWRAA